jgi:hypothetical protein
MNEPPGACMRVNLTTLTMAKYFRDVNKQDVLLFIDNILRFVQAGLEVSTYPWEVVRKIIINYIYNANFFRSNLLNLKYYQFKYFVTSPPQL